MHYQGETIMMKSATVLIITAAVAIAAADQVVQVDVSSALNGRSVSTYANGTLTSANMGLDVSHYGRFLTHSASVFKGDAGTIIAVPDSGTFAATTQLPRVVLNYSNTKATGNQTRWANSSANFTFAVPQGTYSKMFLFFTSS